MTLYRTTPHQTEPKTNSANVLACRFVSQKKCNKKLSVCNILKAFNSFG